MISISAQLWNIIGDRFSFSNRINNNEEDMSVKIQIIGGSGTGKSTLAKFISEQEGITWIDTDRYLWKDETFTETNPIEKRRMMYRQDIANLPDYAASGSVFSWLPEGFDDRDLLVFLSVDETIRMNRLRHREIERNGRSTMRTDENGYDTNDFLEWCKTYWLEQDHGKMGTYADHAHQIERSKCPVLKLDSARPITELHATIMKHFSQS
jgi:adenylate kinase family enzyme